MMKTTMKATESTPAKILIVEDEEDILELLEFNLARAGYEVEGVDSGEKALSAIRAHQPDLILLDLMLPGVDGLEVCRAIKRDPALSGVSVIMVTARGEEADIVKGLELGADDYITKPFSPKVVAARAAAVLRRRERTTRRRSAAHDDPRHHDSSRAP
jgi:two-component system, OmpR family, alkaline phosphatase synthesis response regulator PhoP